MAFKKAVSNEVSNYMATLKAIRRRYSLMSRFLKSCYNAGIFARRAMVDQASATREKRNILVYFALKRLSVLSQRDLDLENCAIFHFQ